MSKVEFENLTITGEAEQEFTIEGNYEVGSEDIEIELYIRNDVTDWFIKAINTGETIYEVGFVSGGIEKRYKVNKVVQVIEYFITLSRS